MTSNVSPERPIRDDGADGGPDDDWAQREGRAPVRGRGSSVLVLLAVLGAGAAIALSQPAPHASGAARLMAPDVVLSVFDTVWVLALAWPRALDARRRAEACGLALLVGAPFHVALAAAAGGGGGHAGASLAIVVAAALAGSVAGRARWYAPSLAVLLFALPLAGYALTDLAGLDALGLVRASPLVMPSLLARSARDVVAADGAAAAGVLLVLAAARGALPRARSTTAACLLLAILCTPSLAAPPDVSATLGGHVRDGRPLVVRAPGAQRVRPVGGVWAGPVGTSGDEFVLLRPRPRGDVLDVQVQAGDGSVATVAIDVRPLTGDRRWTAALDGRPAGDGVRTLRVLDLPTVPEAWLVFDEVVGVPEGLGADQRRALDDRARRESTFLPDATMLPPAPRVFRALAASAQGAPRLPADVARVLGILALLVVVLALLPIARSPRGARGRAWLAVPPVATLLWLLLSASLPGAIRANAVVLESAEGRLVLVRIAAVRDGVVSVAAPDRDGVIVPLRWADDDAPPDGVAVGSRATLALDAGRSAILAVRLPPRVAAEATRPSSGAAADELAGWLRSLGWRTRAILPEETEAGVAIDGARLLRVERLAIGRDD